MPLSAQLIGYFHLSNESFRSVRRELSIEGAPILVATDIIYWIWIMLNIVVEIP